MKQFKILPNKQKGHGESREVKCTGKQLSMAIALHAAKGSSKTAHTLTTILHCVCRYSKIDVNVCLDDKCSIMSHAFSTVKQGQTDNHLHIPTCSCTSSQYTRVLLHEDLLTAIQKATFRLHGLFPIYVSLYYHL